jgi:molybdopterin-containing oxidoreductase family membrane subunit
MDAAALDRSLLPDRPSAGEIDDRILAYGRRRAGRGWWLLFGACLLLVGLLALSIAVTVGVGLGTWGIAVPVAWAFAITNFVWWIGIGHAGTLISAILLLFLQRWRTSINRFAEAMTLFAVVCAALFPLLHLGRPWLFYWLLPYPSRLGLWPQFKSPLVWDVFAITTYLTVSFLFWYLGLVPDFATARDAARSRARRLVYGVLALGWRGSARHFHHYGSAYLLIAGLATPLVVSVHTIVSFDFAVSLVPGWHSTIFPPYFVAGAVFSGFALVVTLLVPARKALGLESLITVRHLENMGKVILLTGWIVTYSYLVELFVDWYHGDPFEAYLTRNRMVGPYAFVYWITIVGNCVAPQLLWWKRARTSPAILWVVALAVQIGMWSERFMLIVTSLHRDFLPSSWGMFTPTWVDLGLLFGSIGLFGALFLLFLRFVPVVPASEVKELARALAAEETGKVHP